MAAHPYFRLFFYGMLGFTYEVIFTSIWDLIFTKSDINFQLRGYSSIWSFFIYGTCSFCGERVYVMAKDRASPWIRGCVYIMMAYSWEFIGGLLLRQFDACSWDYTHFRFDIMGLIALEYAPFWFLAGLFQERIYGYILALHIEKKNVIELNGNQNVIHVKQE